MNGLIEDAIGVKEEEITFVNHPIFSNVAVFLNQLKFLNKSVEEELIAFKKGINAGRASSFAMEKRCLSAFANVTGLTPDEQVEILEEMGAIYVEIHNGRITIDTLIEQMDITPLIKVMTDVYKQQIALESNFISTLTAVVNQMEIFIRHNAKTLKVGEIQKHCYTLLKSYVENVESDVRQIIRGEGLMQSVSILLEKKPEIVFSVPKSIVGWQFMDNRWNYFTQSNMQYLRIFQENYTNIERALKAPNNPTMLSSANRYKPSEVSLIIDGNIQALIVANQGISDRVNKLATAIEALYETVIAADKDKENLSVVLTPFIKLITSWVFVPVLESTCRNKAFIRLLGMLCFHKEKHFNDDKKISWIDQARTLFKQ
jgi:hypothetical protein